MIVNSRLEELSKKVDRFNENDAKKEQGYLLKVQECLKNNRWIIRDEWTNPEIIHLNRYRFFTTKPVVYLVNISTKNFAEKKNKWFKKIKEWIDENCPGRMVPISASYEKEVM